MKTKAIAVAMLAAVLAMSFALVVTPDSDADAENDVVAIGETGYASLSEAITAAENGVTIKLLNNVNEDVTIPAGKEIVLDLAGFTLTNVSKHTIIVEDGAKLTVSGGTVDNITHQKAAIYSNGEVIINGGTFTRSAEVICVSENSFKSSNSWYLIVNMGTMTINGGSFYTGDGTASKLGNLSSLIVNGTEDNSAPRTMTINGGTFTNAANVLKNNSGDVVINDGTLTMDNTVVGWWGGNQCIQHVEGTMTINGGSMSTIGTGVGIDPADAKLMRSVVYVSEDSTSVTITDGSLIADGANTYMFRNKSIEVDIQINGGTFETKTDAVSTIGVGGVSINGGTFVGFKPVAQTDMDISIVITGDVSPVSITASDSMDFEYTVGTLEITVPAGKTFGMDNGAITLSEASLKGTIPAGTTIAVTTKVTVPENVSLTIDTGATVTGGSKSIAIADYITVLGTVSDGMVDAVAKVGNVYCATLSDAIDIVEDRKITLLANVTCVDGLDMDKVELNGFTVNHSYDAGTTTKQPTFTSKGTFTRTCTVCGHTIDSEIQMVTLSDIITAFGSIDGYTPVGEATVTSANVLSMRYGGSYTGTGVMNDLARFLGVLHDTGRVQALSYGTDGYTWNETLGNQGSNWAKGETSLISVLVKDFRNGVITNKVALKLDNGTSFEICFDARFVAVVGDITSDGTVTYSVFQDAVSQGGTVTLLSDVTDTAAITIDRNVTILGNNKAFAGTFVLSESKDGTPYGVTIADLVMEGTGACAVSSDVKGVSLILSKVSVKGYTASVNVSDAVSVSVTGSSFDGAVKVTSKDAFDVTMDSLKFSIPAGKAFAMDGTAMTVSEASIEGIVKDTVDVIVTSKATIPAGKTVEGTIWFDTTKDNGITLSSVKAGTSGVTLTKGSVEIIGDFISSEDGTITVTGIARIVGDSTIDGIELVVPKGASLTVEEGASVTGTGSISNAGTVKVLGSLTTVLDNTSDAVVQVSLTGSVDSEKIRGDGKVSFDSIILRDIGTKYYRVGDKVDIPVTVNPATATLTIDYTVSPSWLTIRDGHIVGIVAQDGSFNVTVKASMEDRETVSESFVINAVPGVDPQEPEEHEFTFKEIVKIAVIILVVLMVICLVTRAFIG